MSAIARYRKLQNKLDALTQAGLGSSSEAKEIRFALGTVEPHLSADELAILGVGKVAESAGAESALSDLKGDTDTDKPARVRKPKAPILDTETAPVVETPAPPIVEAGAPAV